MYHTLPLIISVCCFFTLLTWYKPKWSLGFLILCLPAYLSRFTIGFTPFTLLEVMIWIVFIIWLIKNRQLIGQRRLGKTPYTLPIILLLLVATISIEVSPNLRGALGIWRAYFIEPIIFFIVFYHTFKDKKSLVPIFWGLGLSALVVSALAIYQKYTGWLIPNPIWQAVDTRRVTSFFGYPNAVGWYLSPIVIFFAGYLIKIIGELKKYSWQKLLKLIFILIVISASLLSIFFAVSEGTILGLAFGLFFLGMLAKRWTSVLTISAVIVIIILILINPTLKQEIITEATFQGVSGQVRLDMWRESWQMLRDRPIFGAGLAGYQITMAPYHPAHHIEIFLYPHNLFLNFWTELGMAGLLIFLWIFVKFFSQGWKLLYTNQRLMSLTLLAIMLGLIVHGLVDAPYFKNDLAVMFWLWVALMCVVNNGVIKT